MLWINKVYLCVSALSHPSNYTFPAARRAQLFVNTLMDQLWEVSAHKHTLEHTQADTALQGKHSQIDLLNSVLSRVLCAAV